MRDALATSALHSDYTVLHSDCTVVITDQMYNFGAETHLGEYSLYCPEIAISTCA